MVRWLPRQEAKITASMSVGITEIGIKTVEQELARGGTYVILSLLHEHSPRIISDIARETDIPIEETKERVRVLAKNGYIRFVGRD